MPLISVRIPQLGEGLQEALLVEFLKQPGDMVKRDEPIYIMETDKAATEVESPYDGKLIEWTVNTGTVLEIGSQIGKMEVAEGVVDMTAGHAPPAAEPANPDTAKPDASAVPKSGSAVRRAGVTIPPRTRKYLKEKGLMDVADQIPAKGSKLMPDDVDRYLAAQCADPSAEDFDRVDLPQSQIVLNYRLPRGGQACVPVTVMSEVGFGGLEKIRARVKSQGGPTPFAMCCWCIVQAMKNHKKFRSALTTDAKALKIFRRVNLGVAVALPGDELVTAVVNGADEMDQSAFFQALTTQIKTARDGNDQADGSTTITVSNIGQAGMRMGIPAIVAPAVATLTIGETYSQPVPKGDGFEFKRVVMVTLSFDHRITNGVGAANFLGDVSHQIESFEFSGG